MINQRVDRNELIKRIAARTGKSPKTAELMLDAVLEEIYESLKRGEGVSLKNFGTFYVRSEPDSWVFKFNPAQRLRKVFGWSSTLTMSD